MIERIVCVILLIAAIGLLLELDRRDTELTGATDLCDRLQSELHRRDLETQKAKAEAQCYHEECVRLAFEYMSDTIYTLPCNGRKVEIGGAR